jgi:hypothetical protein
VRSRKEIAGFLERDRVVGKIGHAAASASRFWWRRFAPLAHWRARGAVGRLFIEAATIIDGL